MTFQIKKVMDYSVNKLIGIMFNTLYWSLNIYTNVLITISTINWGCHLPIYVIVIIKNSLKAIEQCMVFGTLILRKYIILVGGG